METAKNGGSNCVMGCKREGVPGGYSEVFADRVPNALAFHLLGARCDCQVLCSPQYIQNIVGTGGKKFITYFRLRDGCDAPGYNTAPELARL